MSERVATLTEALWDADAEVRYHAARILARMMGAVPPAVEALTEALWDADTEVRYHAACAIGRIVRAGGGVGRSSISACPRLTPRQGDNAMCARSERVATLTEATRGPDAEVRYRASRTLGRMMSAVPPAVKALTEALTDPAPDVRYQAAWALGRIVRAVPLVDN